MATHSSATPVSNRRLEEAHRLPGWEDEVGNDLSMSLYVLGRAIYEHGRAVAEQVDAETEER